MLDLFPALFVVLLPKRPLERYLGLLAPDFSERPSRMSPYER